MVKWVRGIAIEPDFRGLNTLKMFWINYVNTNNNFILEHDPGLELFESHKLRTKYFDKICTYRVIRTK